MKRPSEMTFEELKNEIKYVVNLLDEQPIHHVAYLAELIEQLIKKTNNELEVK